MIEKCHLFTYMTGKTFGKTTAPSAKYWYKILVSLSSVLYLTIVANTVKTSAWILKSVRTSGSRSILFSLLTDTLVLRFWKIYSHFDDIIKIKHKLQRALINKFIRKTDIHTHTHTQGDYSLLLYTLLDVTLASDWLKDFCSLVVGTENERCVLKRARALW